MNDIVIRGERIGKLYRIGELQGYKVLRDSLNEAFFAPLRAVRSIWKGRPKDAISKPRYNYIWALKDVSFEIKRGETVGFIGSNGAGKSTLLKILCRISEPTEGQGEIHGRVASLLEVGTGFHPELTGRENIYLNGAILGMKRQEIKGKFDEIVAFAEMDRFIDTPVKHYSSGMYVRLAFSVAAHLEPEILFVDEVLAVGDTSFQRKCMGKMGDIAGEGRTVVFVSHNMSAVRSLCNRAILLKAGKKIMEGEPAKVIRAYLEMETVQGEMPEREIVWATEKDAPGGDELRLVSIRLRGTEGKLAPGFDVERPLEVDISYRVKCRLPDLRIRLSLLTSQGEVAFSTTDHDLRKEEVQPGEYRSTCTIPGGLLNIGEYVVKVGGGIPMVKPLLPGREYLSFTTVGEEGEGSLIPRRLPGVVSPKLNWVIDKLDG